MSNRQPGPKSEIQSFLYGFVQPSASGIYDRSGASVLKMEGRFYSVCIYYLQTPYGWLSAPWLEIGGQVVLDEPLRIESGISLTSEDAIDRALLAVVGKSESHAAFLEEALTAPREAKAARLASSLAVSMLSGIEDIVLDEAFAFPLTAVS